MLDNLHFLYMNTWIFSLVVKQDKKEKKRNPFGAKSFLQLVMGACNVVVCCS